ncbi:MAG TPA: TMEM175 family protein [Bacteroidia bacterium]|jgi:uncharacterized membrane protein|nr:TMEM175 family protein [Bacteroidia bacterium]
MNKSRLETFSDGVFSIVITLLVLNIAIPTITHYDALPVTLIQLWPKFLAYIMSFALIGLYWIGHHFYFDRIKLVDGNFVGLNMLLLLLISVMPFPTALLGQFPYGPLPLTIYGINLIVVNLLSFFMLMYLYRHKHLTNEHFKDEFYKLQLPLFFWINLIYAIGIVFAFIYPSVSYVLYIVNLVMGIKIYVKRMNHAAKPEKHPAA